MKSESKQRYDFWEGIHDWFTAYMISGVLTVAVHGGLWLLLGVAVPIIVLLTFMMNNPRLKFKIHAFALVVYTASLIGLIIKTGNQTLDVLWICMIVLGFTQAILTVRYYQNKLKK